MPRNCHPRAKSCRTAAPCAVAVLQAPQLSARPGSKCCRTFLPKTQTTIQPLVPYLDTLRWVLIAIALIGIAVPIHARLDDWKRGQR